MSDSILQALARQESTPTGVLEAAAQSWAGKAKAKAVEEVALHPNASRKLRRYLLDLSEKESKATFEMIRRMLLTHHGRVENPMSEDEQVELVKELDDYQATMLLADMSQWRSPAETDIPVTSWLGFPARMQAILSSADNADAPFGKVGA